MRILHYILPLFALALTACRGDIYVDDTPPVEVAPPDPLADSFYLLNEGNMGSNRASVDFYDAADGSYTRNIYTRANPTEVKELGDVGNSLTIYGDRMYIVVNCSHKVQVVDALTCRSLGKIDIPNPRYVVGDGEFVYVSSYVSPVPGDRKAPRGAVFRIDPQTLTIVDRVDVGYQPEEMAIIDGRLYVANSGGYRAPDYDSTISVVNLSTFAVTATFDVAPNLHHLRVDSFGRLLVTSRGNQADIAPALYAVSPVTGNIMTKSDVPVTNLALADGAIYTFAADAKSARYDTLDPLTLTRQGTWMNATLAASIRMPYALAVGPRSGRIYISDARNYVSSGRLHCLPAPGEAPLWTVSTGDIPASIAFMH